MMKWIKSRYATIDGDEIFVPVSKNGHVMIFTRRDKPSNAKPIYGHIYLNEGTGLGKKRLGILLGFAVFSKETTLMWYRDKPVEACA